jgi:hypothetical protein
VLCLVVEEFAAACDKRIHTKDMRQGLQAPGTGGMRYRADITAGNSRCSGAESLLNLLLRGLDETGWQEAIYGQNVLQTRSTKGPRPLSFTSARSSYPDEADRWKLDVCFINSSPVELPYACTVEGDRRHVQNVGAGG